MFTMWLPIVQLSPPEPNIMASSLPSSTSRYSFLSEQVDKLLT